MNKFNLRNRYKFNRNYIFIVTAFLFIIGIGFAYIQSTFSISGSADIKNGAWNIHFANIQNIDNYDLIDINRRIKGKNDLIEFDRAKIEELESEIIRLNGLYETCIDDIVPAEPEVPLSDSGEEINLSPSIEQEDIIESDETYYCLDIELQIDSLQWEINNYEYEIPVLQSELEQLIAEKNKMAPAIVISEDAKSISIPLLLESKLDFIEFEVDVVNEGKYDAMIADLASASIPDDLVNFLKIAVTYQNGNEIQNNDLLAAGETKTLKIKLSFKDDVGNEEVPIGEYKIDYGIPYIQATSDAVDRS